MSFSLACPEIDQAHKRRSKLPFAASGNEERRSVGRKITHHGRHTLPQFHTLPNRLCVRPVRPIVVPSTREKVTFNLGRASGAGEAPSSGGF